MRQRGKRWLFAIVAAASGLLGGALIGEAAVRLLGLQPERYELPRWHVLHEGDFKHWGKLGRGHIKRPGPFAERGFRMGEYVPGATMKVVYDSNPRGYFDDDNGVVMSINGLGLRGPETTAAKPAGTLRLLGLGDSFTFGAGVREGDTYLRRLEGSLNGSPPSPACRYEVLNAGTQGYNTRDEVLYLEQRWLALDPDLVVITFYVNDAYSDAAMLNMGQDLGIYERPDGLARYSRLVDLVQHRLRVRAIDRRTRAYYSEAYFSRPGQALAGGDRSEVDWHVSRGALLYAEKLLRERGVRLALVIFPELYRLDDGYPFAGIHELVATTCREVGIPVLDLFDTFQGHAAPDLWVHPSDHHPNEDAHALAAEAIDTFLRESVLGADADCAEGLR